MYRRKATEVHGLRFSYRIHASSRDGAASQSRHHEESQDSGGRAIGVPGGL